MTHPTLPPEVSEPLARFRGEPPPAPAWFEQALAQEPERFAVEVEGASIECLAWGERGKPGLIFVHGASAHADWWSFIAPFFAADYRVAALSLSGMGGSDWRDAYSYETFFAEVDACAREAGLYESGTAPVYIGHSFGGAVVYLAALVHPGRMSATLMLDTGFSNIQTEEAGDPEKPSAPRRPTGKVYATLEEALARFRLLPPQEPKNLFIADFIARRSLRPAAMPDGRLGWTWRFDPALFSRLDRSAMKRLVEAPSGRVTHICGDRSLVAARMAARPGMLAANVESIVIPDCAHHIMVDQPLALVSVLRDCLTLQPTEP